MRPISGLLGTLEYALCMTIQPCSLRPQQALPSTMEVERGSGLSLRATPMARNGSARHVGTVHRQAKGFSASDAGLKRTNPKLRRIHCISEPDASIPFE